LEGFKGGKEPFEPAPAVRFGPGQKGAGELFGEAAGDLVATLRASPHELRSLAGLGLTVGRGGM
jgi:hypothetical protein